MGPPRALWVPFMLGRPLGAPDDPDFQKRVLKSALKLLEITTGPVLEDYPEEAPEPKSSPQPLACPVSFTRPADIALPLEALLSAFAQEIAQLQNWFDIAKKKTGRTTSTTSGLSAEEAARFISDFLMGKPVIWPLAGMSPAANLKMAVEDVKSYYLEAVAAQPGQDTRSDKLLNWFWGETAAAPVINELRKYSLKSEDRELNLLGALLLIPRAQMHRFRDPA